MERLNRGSNFVHATIERMGDVAPVHRVPNNQHAIEQLNNHVSETRNEMKEVVKHVERAQAENTTLNKRVSHMEKKLEEHSTLLLEVLNLLRANAVKDMLPKEDLVMEPHSQSVVVEPVAEPVTEPVFHSELVVEDAVPESATEPVKKTPKKKVAKKKKPIADPDDTLEIELND